MSLPQLQVRIDKPVESEFPIQVWTGKTADGKQTLIKLVRNQDPGGSTLGQRLLDRGDLARKVIHPNVTRVLEVGNQEGAYFLASEYVRGRPDGSTVASLVKDGSLPVPRAVRIVYRVAEALVAAEAVSVVHGCIKPSKIMLTAHPRNADFDLVKLRDLAIGNLRFYQGHAALNIETSLYVAPELIRIGQEPDVRSDIYSLGVVFYQMLAGRVPISGPTVDQINIKKFGAEKPPRLNSIRPDLRLEHAERLEMVVDKMLAHRPQDRYGSPRELLKALDDLMVSLDIPLEPLEPSPPAREYDVWRDGSLVKMRRGAQLPARCVRCNRDADGGMSPQRLTWHHAALYLLMFFPGVAFYLIAAAIWQKSESVEIGLCRHHRTSRMSKLIACGALIIAGAALGVVAYLAESWAIAAAAGLLVVGSALFGAFATEFLNVRHMNERVISLSGAGPRFLGSLPTSQRMTPAPRQRVTGSAPIPLKSI